MDFQLSFNISDKIYLRDPEKTEKGTEIVKQAIDLIYKLGFEDFTFKKLAVETKTTEATIYRYFENKHRLLLYILNWYWYYLEFLVIFKAQNIADPKMRLKAIIQLLSHEFPESTSGLEYNKKYLYQIVIAESSKVYLVKEVNEINKDDAFKAYKELTGKISNAISEYNPKYKYPRSLSSTLIEASHFQQFFHEHLPKLTDSKSKDDNEYVSSFLENLLFKVLG